MSEDGFVFQQGGTKRAYADFRAASRQTMNVDTFAYRPRSDLARHPEHVEAVACRLAEGKRLTVYVGRDGKISALGLPWMPLP